ncbi:hypothetical protein [Treponema primitia]|uniref:hypothetical protein n=1 Tax=Treponema primitia TaxID=88058 RepID=UPI0002554C13|nr:hypothetical protein [Treponema primitia]
MNKVVDENTLKELDAEFAKRYSDKVIVDGIVGWGYDNNIYFDSDIRILWILKEGNQPENEKKKCEFRDLLFEVAKGDYPNAPWWKHTYGLVAKVSYGILFDKKNYNDVPDEEDIKDIFKEIAVINVKKTAGSSSANPNEIEQFYNNDKDLLIRQINALKPDIIINCSRVRSLFDDLKTRDESAEFGPFEGSFQVTISDDKQSSYDRLLINAYHPNIRGGGNEKKAAYFQTIINCLEWDKQHKKAT